MIDDLRTILTSPMGKRALIIVDLQNDFCPGGTLAVPEGDQIVPIVNRLTEKFTQAGRPIYATRDWHPENHCSFKTQGGIWPPHCVQNTPGAEFHPDFRLPTTATIISKADEPGKEAYSGFQGTHLSQQLKKLGVEELVICGLATDYCVKATALDGLKEGFKVIVAENAIRGVNVQPDDSNKAITEMKKTGADIVIGDPVIL